MMQCLWGSRGKILILEANSLQLVKLWVDASYAVHPDSHTGAAKSLGKGVAYGTSTRQKLNMKSSTEAELVGVLPGSTGVRNYG